MEKRIDEAWKELVEKEKQTKPANGQETQAPRQPDFSSFLSSLFIETLICLGELPNPATKQKEENLEQARYIIDTISILKDKTKGNLNSDESTMLENILYEARMKYIAKSKT